MIKEHAGKRLSAARGRLPNASHSAKLDALYESLDVDHGDGDNGNFLFGWQCENPFAKGLLSATKQRTKSIDYINYAYIDQDEKLATKLCKMHSQLDGIKPAAALCAMGSTSVLFAWAAFLRKKSVKQVYFIPPLYFTLHIALDMFGVRAIPVSKAHAFEKDFRLNLPNERDAVLLLTDPVWYAGIPVPVGAIQDLVRWQKRTNGIIFVDGSFQYMRWDGRCDEPTAKLARSLTFRLISPTKSLVVHGYRFAYLLLPETWKRDFSWTYTHIYGSCVADSIAFGHEALTAMSARAITNNLTAFISERHRSLRRLGVIESVLEPRCGYFSFEKVNVALPPGYMSLDGKYFDQPKFPGYAKLNLLSPSIGLIDGTTKNDLALTR